ncbi:MAG: tetratricopeptide repeat protein [Elusimicrobiales bacterium]
MEQGKAKIAALALVVAIAAAVFRPAAGAGFIDVDDGDYIAASGAGIKEIFTTSPLGYYHPLTLLSFRAERSLAGLSPAVCHSTNIALHLGCCALVWRLALALGLQIPAAALAALLFALHPTRVEPVAWVSGRKELLCCLFFLAALLAYARYLKNRAWHALAAPLLLFCCALLSKPTIVFGPLILLLLDWRAGRADVKRMLAEKIPFFAASAAAVLVSVKAGLFFPGEVAAQHSAIGAAERLALGARTLRFYLHKTVFPAGLAAPYPLIETSGSVLPDMLFAAFAAGLCWFLIARRELRPAGLCAAAFALAVAPVLFFPALIPSDRYLYTPAVALFLPAGAALSAMRGKAVASAAAAALLGVFAVYDGSLIKRWNNNLDFWSGVIARTTPRVETQTSRGRGAVFDRAVLAEAYLKRGDALLAASRPEAAIADYSRSIGLKPEISTISSTSSQPKAYANRGTAYLISGHYEQAVADYTQSLALAPGDAGTYTNRGCAYHSLKLYAKAIADYDRAIKLKPDFDQAYANRGTSYGKLGRHEQALADFTTALHINPGNALAKIGRGVAEEMLRGT